MNKAAIAQKKESVAELADYLKRAKSFLVFEYHGMSALDMGKLRRQMLKHDGKVLIFKNTMLERALKDAGMPSMDAVLQGPNAIAFGLQDEVAPFKIVVDAIKDKKSLKVKAGRIEGKVVDAKEATVMAALPSRTDMYAMIANMLMSPVTSFARAVDAIAKSKEQPASEPAPVPAAA